MAVPVTVASGANLPPLTSPVTTTVTVADNGMPALTATAEVEITITAGNVAPVFGNTPYVFSVTENAASGDEVGLVSATDSNAGDLLTYTLSGEGAANFMVTNGADVASGEEASVVVSSTATLDHETATSYTLQVQVSDDATSALTATETVEVTVTDIATAPVITVSGTQAPLNEGMVDAETATGLTVNAIDDGDGVVFSVGDNRFSIAGDGTLNIVAGSVFDYEDPANPSGIVTLTVTATDNMMSSTEMVEITITDVATAPVITVSGSQTLVLNEGTVDAETATGYMVAATDEDEDGVAFSVSDPRFIVATNDMLNVVAGSVFDYETENPITLTVIATDDNFGSLTDMETVDDITIMDVIFSTMLSTIDVGSNSAPAFGDVDGDGNDDLLIGKGDGLLNYYRWDGTDWMEQTGTNNPFDTTTYGAGFYVGTSSGPAFGDVDDGDGDLLIGVNGSKALNYFQLDGTDWTVQPSPLSIGAGSHLKPTFGDFDDDGDDDLIVGELLADDGLNYFRWGDGSGGTGWSDQTTSLGRPLTNEIGRSAPAFGDVDGDGDDDLLIGGGDGDLRYYRWGESNGSGMGWTGQSPSLPAPLNTSVGSNASPTFGDIDKDGDMDVVVGKDDGGLVIYYRLADGTWSTTSDAI